MDRKRVARRRVGDPLIHRRTFILGFVAASAVGTWFAASTVDPAAASAALKIAGTDLRAWFFILALVCIGLDFRIIAIREAGVRPVLVFAGATVLALILASTIFAVFRLS